MFEKLTKKIVDSVSKKIVVEVPVVPAALATGCAVVIIVLLARQTNVTVVNNHYIWYPG